MNPSKMLILLAAFVSLATTAFAQVTPPPIPSEMTFAGEAVPLGNFDVRERLDGELLVNTYQHSATLLKLKRAKRSFAVIEPILREFGLPDDLKYLAVIESGLDETAESASGAAGVWQIMDSTAVELGLEVRRDQGKPMVDERYDLEKATRAACKHLKKLHERHGSWVNAIVAYNWGSRNLTETMKAQNAATYYDLNSGSQEVMRYAFRAFAHKLIMEHPKEYGFHLSAKDEYDPLPETQWVTVKESIASLGQWATQQGTTYRMLKLHNPWLRSSSLTVPAGKSYQIKVPKS
jgi:hypothetical protein